MREGKMVYFGCLGDMTKIAVTPIYSKTNFKTLFLWVLYDLETCYVTLGTWALNDDPMFNFAYFTAMLNFVSDAILYWKPE